MDLPFKIRDRWKEYLKYSTLGLEMGLSVAVGFGVGSWLDEKLGTTPWMLLFWLFCGLVAAFRPIFRMVIDVRKRNRDNENKFI